MSKILRGIPPERWRYSLLAGIITATPTTNQASQLLHPWWLSIVVGALGIAGIAMLFDILIPVERFSRNLKIIYFAAIIAVAILINWLTFGIRN